MLLIISGVVILMIFLEDYDIIALLALESKFFIPGDFYIPMKGLL